MLQLLTCNCARDPHLALLYSSIITKILLQYQFAAGSTLYPLLCSRITSDLPNPPNPETASGPQPTVQVGPIRLGAFTFDAEDQESLKRQILQSELKKVERLVHDFASRFDGGMEGEPGKGSVGGGVSGLYESVGGWLRSELLRTNYRIRKGTWLGAERERGGEMSEGSL